jgi:hypothetical protein
LGGEEAGTIVLTSSIWQALLFSSGRTMDKSIIIGIISVIATVVFGIWGIILVVRRKYPGKITFIQEDSLSLFNDIVKNMPELSISFRNQPVKENLVLLKGAFVNTGSKDIETSMIIENIAINLPEGFRWANAKVVDVPNQVQAKSIIKNDNLLSFELGLFRCREFFKFEGLAEVPSDKTSNSPNKRLVNSLKLTHRIADTGRISTIQLPREVPKKSAWLKHITTLSIVIITCFVAFLSYREGQPIKTNFIIDDGSHKEIQVSVRRNPYTGNFLIKEINGTFKEICSSQKFYMKPKLKPVDGSSWFDNKDILILLPILIINVIIIICLNYSDSLKIRRIKKLITINKAVG